LQAWAKELFVRPDADGDLSLGRASNNLGNLRDLRFPRTFDRQGAYGDSQGLGIDLINKIKAYRMQEMGLDMVEANEYLGFRSDERRYSNAASIIRLLGIRSIAVMSNNPDKIDKIRSEGIEITRRIQVVIPSNPHSEIYLETKREVMGHLF
jgi:GTP cyclohydrolase II